MKKLGESWAPALNNEWMRYRHSCSEVVFDSAPSMFIPGDNWDLEMGMLEDSLRHGLRS